jgi:ribosomal protein S4
MYRQIPVGSKLLQKKWEQKEREMHLSKLKEAKPSVDVREPTQFRHIKKKLKKNQILEGKQCLLSQLIRCRSLHGDWAWEPHTAGEDDAHNANYYKQ